MLVSVVMLLTFFAAIKFTSSDLESKPEIRSRASLKSLSRSPPTHQQLQLQQVAQLTDQVKRLEARIAELEASRKSYPTVPFRNVKDRKRILITGGAGFVGSHLTDRLMNEGHEVS